MLLQNLSSELHLKIYFLLPFIWFVFAAPCFIYAQNQTIEHESLKDIDGNTYPTIKIDKQLWMAKNLQVTKFRNGDLIPPRRHAEDWIDAKEKEVASLAVTPFRGIPGMESSGEVARAYGLLYNWYAVNDERGLCPQGWHVPSEEDWETLISYLTIEHNLTNNLYNKSQNGIGGALKSCRQEGGSRINDHCNTSEHPRWDAFDTFQGSDRFGFAALPGGAVSTDGRFYPVGVAGHWWTSSESSEDFAWVKIMSHDFGGIFDMYLNKGMGLSVRCVKRGYSGR